MNNVSDTGLGGLLAHKAVSISVLEVILVQIMTGSKYNTVGTHIRAHDHMGSYSETIASRNLLKELYEQ